MSGRSPRNWSFAIGGGENDQRVASAWLSESPELLSKWEVTGGRWPGSVSGKDRFLYYAAGHQRLVAAGKVTGVDKAGGVMRVQLRLVVPVIEFASPLEVLEKNSQDFTGWKAVELTDGEFGRGVDALGIWDWKVS